MSSAFALVEGEHLESSHSPAEPLTVSRKIEALSNQHQDEVLAFLSRRPVHTVFMAGLIRDNGIISFRNRGTFFGYRNHRGELAGVALIGQKTLVEATDDFAFETFASLVPENTYAHLIRGEQNQIDALLPYYEAAGRSPRLVRAEILLEQQHALRSVPGEPNLRVAAAADLQAVVSINASMAFEENGIDPRQRDPEGLCERAARRISQGRVWILTQRGKIIFKVDVISETPQAAFLEGVYVAPEVRRQGYGLRCMTQLGRMMLDHVKTLCLVVNEGNVKARAFYLTAGYSFNSNYTTAYFPAK
jgi:predicted GNAT family acetyltransferase